MTCSVNRAFLFLPVLALCALGCGPDVVLLCEDYNEALSECIKTAFPENPAAVEDLEAIDCEATYGDTHGDEARKEADLYACQTAALEATDCTTPEGFAALDEPNLACLAEAD